MKKIHIGQVPLYHFSFLFGYPEIIHFSTTRQGGTSKGSYTSLNLGFNSGDEKQSVQANRGIFARMLGIKPEQLVFGVQTHSAKIARITSDVLDWDFQMRRRILAETDALITNEPNICVAVKTADCIPVLLFDPAHKAAAAIHAGWRGTVARIVAQTVDAMKQEYGTQPKDIVAGIGPGIGPEVYQVGPEVVEMVHRQLGENHRLIQYRVSKTDRQETPYLDLWKANHLQLIDAGIPEENIEVARLCTFSHADDFFSARRDGAVTGRMATGIMIKEGHKK